MSDISERAFVRTREVLPAEYHSSPAALAVYLKYYLLAKLGSLLVSDRHSLQSDRRERMGEQVNLVSQMVQLAFDLSFEEMADMAERAGIDFNPEWVSPDYTGRLAQVASEELLGKPVSPELLIYPEPVAPSAFVLEGRPIHAILFGTFTHFLNEFYALVTDAYCSDMRHAGKAKRTLVAACSSWFSAPGYLERCMRWRGQGTDLFEEARLSSPLPIHIAHTLCASSVRHVFFDNWCEKGKVIQVNPIDPSEIADDKYACYRRWRTSGVPTPDTILFMTKVSHKELEPHVESFRERIVEQSSAPSPGWVFVQPNFGTEGEKVKPFRLPESTREAAEYIGELTRKEPAILREARGNVYYKSEEQPGAFACDLRLNVSFDGESHHAESGYLQVASKENDLASSAGLGGRVVSFRKGALQNLVFRRNRQEGPEFYSLQLCDEDLAELARIACSAAEIFKGLYLVGIDLKLEVEEMPDGTRKVSAWVLDANPRPSGMMHSDSLPLGNVPPEPCVSDKVWVAFDKMAERSSETRQP